MSLSFLETLPLADEFLRSLNENDVSYFIKQFLMKKIFVSLQSFGKLIKVKNKVPLRYGFNSHRRCFIKEAVLKTFAVFTRNTCVGVSVLCLLSWRLLLLFITRWETLYLKKEEKWCSRPNITVSRRCSIRNLFLEILQDSQENTYARVNFIKKETLAQVFSSEFCEISKNTFSYRTPPVAASDCIHIHFVHNTFSIHSEYSF